MQEALSTYVGWPRKSAVRPIKLAGAGFYYSGVRDRVICKVCDLIADHWIEVHDPQTRHRDLKPECPLVSSFPSKADVVDCCQVSQNDVFHSYIPNENEANPNMSQITFYEQNESNQVCTSNSILENDFLKFNLTPVNEEYANLDMTYFEGRLYTYQNWPLPYLSKEVMAKAGFYFTEIGDRVQCAFCKGVLKRWSKCDIPIREHRRHFPDCKFARGSVKDTVYNPSEKRTTETLEFNRLNTFSKCPYNRDFRDLSDAGFIFNDKKNIIECHECHTVFNKLKSKIDPWEYHAKKVGLKCNFLVKTKGVQYIESILNTFKTPDNCDVTDSSSNSDNRRTVVLIEPSAVPAPVTPEFKLHNPVQSGRVFNLEAYMKCDLVKQVEGMGFSNRIIREFIKNNRKFFPSFPIIMQEFMEYYEKISGRVVESRHANDDKSEEKKPKSKKKKNKNKSKNKNENHDTNFEKENAPSNQIEKSGENSDDKSDAAMAIATNKLKQENERLMEEKKCIICVDNDRNTIFSPCFHLISCWGCSKKIKFCPMCKEKIQKFNKVFMP